jgi:hypothetical protein
MSPESLNERSIDLSARLCDLSKLAQFLGFEATNGDKHLFTVLLTIEDYSSELARLHEQHARRNKELKDVAGAVAA